MTPPILDAQINDVNWRRNGEKWNETVADRIDVGGAFERRRVRTKQRHAVRFRLTAVCAIW